MTAYVNRRNEESSSGAINYKMIRQRFSETLNVEPMMGYCWATVFDGDPTVQSLKDGSLLGHRLRR